MLKGMVDAYVSSGMKDAGYQYFVLDDGWMTRNATRKATWLPIQRNSLTE
ncbi:hypothetical protein [Mucilaginibacter sp.]